MTKCFSIFFFCLGVHLNAYQKRNIDHCRESPKVAVKKHGEMVTEGANTAPPETVGLLVKHKKHKALGVEGCSGIHWPSVEQWQEHCADNLISWGFILSLLVLNLLTLGMSWHISRSQVFSSMKWEFKVSIRCISWASQVVLVVKNQAANAGHIRDMGSNPWLGRSPGGEYGNPLHNYCLESPMDRGSWQVIAHMVAQSRTWLKRLSTCTGKMPLRANSVHERDWVREHVCLPFHSYHLCIKRMALRLWHTPNGLLDTKLIDWKGYQQNCWRQRPLINKWNKQIEHHKARQLGKNISWWLRLQRIFLQCQRPKFDP